MAQWVNLGFHVANGYHQAYDFENSQTVARLADPDPASLNYFRLPKPRTIDPEAWPWMYRDEVAIPAKKDQKANQNADLDDFPQDPDDRAVVK